MEKIIYLVSCEELSSDRIILQNFLEKKVNFWTEKGITFHVFDFTKANEDTKQCFPKNADLVVFLYGSKLRKLIEADFEKDFGIYQEKTFPIVFLYHKDKKVLLSQVNRNDQVSLWSFQDKIKELGYQEVVYENSAELLLHFWDQLEKIVETDLSVFIKSSPSFEKDLTSVPFDLTKPPFIPDWFIERNNEIKEMQEALESQGSNILIITGDPGSGKSYLLSEFYTKFRNRYKYVGWISCSESLDLELIRNLSEPLKITYPIKQTSKENINTLMDVLTKLSGPNLLVIENVNDAKDLMANNKILSQCNNFTFLITSTETINSPICFPVRKVNIEVSLQIFKKWYPRLQPLDEYLFLDFWNVISGNLLILELLAKSFYQFNIGKDRLSFKNLISNLGNKTTFEILCYLYKTSKVTKLSQSECKLLSFFAILPSEAIEYDILEKLVCSDSFSTTLSSLSQMGWISTNQLTRNYRCSPLIQKTVTTSNQDLYENCTDLVDSLVDLLETDDFDTPLWVRFSENIIRSIGLQNYNDGILCDRLGDYFDSIGRVDQAIKYYSLDLQLTKDLLKTFPMSLEYKEGLAISYEKIGYFYKKQINEKETALKNLKLAEGFWINLTQEYPEKDEYKESLQSIQLEIENI